MDRPEMKLEDFGAAVRDALASEAATTDDIRQARDGFLREFSIHGRSAKDRFAGPSENA